MNRKLLVLAVVSLGLASRSFIPCALAQEKTGHALPPEEAEAIKAWGRSTAVYAATYGSSIVGMYNLRETVAVGPKAKVRANELWRLPNIATPKIAEEAGYVTPNVNTLYGFGFLDLSQEPIVLTAPDSDGRYYMVELIDMWNNAFAYAAGKKVGYKGGKFAVVGPDWKGDLPKELKRIDAPTRWVAVQPRIHVKDPADLTGAQKVLAAITVQGLAEYQGKPAPKPLTYKYETPKLVPKVASSQLRFVDPMQFWSIFVAAMNENPPPKSQIDALMPNFRYLGIEFGKPWNPDKVNPLVLEQMKVAAAEIGPMMNRVAPIVGTSGNGWVASPYTFGDPGADYLTRGINAVLGLTANVTTEAFYILGSVDAKGELLTGKRNYTITFAPSLPFTKVDPPGFWSVTMYDGVTKLTVENPIDRYSLGSDNKMQMNKDGTFTMYLQAKSPGTDKESNWLPCPEGPFYLLLRNYGPAAAADAALRNPADMKLMPPIVPFGAR